MSVYYLTKHCLVDGITEVDTDTTETAGIYSQSPRTRLSDSGDAVEHYRKPHDWYSDRYVIGREAFTSLKDAIADAQQRRTKKLVSLCKQITKLESLTF